MEKVGFCKQIRLVIILFFLGCALSTADAQVTRGQVLRLFVQANTFRNKGNNEKAIETYREIATLAPRYPDTYLRMAEIYEEAKNYESAIVMYRKYINLEMDDAKVKEPSMKLKALEAQLGMGHYEDAEEKEAMQLFAKYNVLNKAPESNSPKTSSEVVEKKEVESTKVKTEEGIALFSQFKDEGDVVANADKKADVEQSKDHGADDSEIMDFARPMQLESGQQSLSLFNLSALVETRNEVLQSQSEDDLDEIARHKEDSIAEVNQRVNKYIESSIEEERSKILQQNAHTLSTIASSGHIDEDEIVLDDNFLANVHKQTTVQSTETEKDSPQLTLKSCDEPIHTYLKQDRLSQYGIKRTAASIPIAVKEQELESLLEGRWVSSECNGSGHEIWMFDISKAGDNWNVSLDDFSGAYLDDDNVLEVSWNAIKHMWSNDRAISTKLKELRAKTVSASLSNGMVTYTFVTEHQHKPNKTVYTWSRNILDGVTGFIPFGGVVSQVGNTLINYISEKDLQKNYTTTLQFYLKPLTANALRCEYVVSEKERSSEGEKEISRERKSCLLYRATADYKGIDFVYDGEHNVINKKLFALIKEEAKSDADKLFPLAYMAYYGAGTKKSISHAVHLMQELIEKKDCERAKAWLIPICYNLSMDVESYPLRIVRQKFRDIADDLLSDLLLENYAYAYSLQADIYASNGTNINMIVPSYLKAAELGDVYALYKLGILYWEGQYEEKNIEKSISYLNQAAEKGYADAYLQLALLYKQGKVVEKDYNKYIDNLFHAINDGSTKALKELSDAYFLGLGVEQNFVIGNHIKGHYMRATCNEWKEILNIYGYNTMF